MYLEYDDQYITITHSIVEVIFQTGPVRMY
jgi:hypothetical protein